MPHPGTSVMGIAATAAVTAVVIRGAIVPESTVIVQFDGHGWWARHNFRLVIP